MWIRHYSLYTYCYDTYLVEMRDLPNVRQIWLMPTSIVTSNVKRNAAGSA